MSPLSFALVGLQMVAASVPPASAAPAPGPSASVPIPLEAMLEPVRTLYGLPALAAAVVIQGKVVAVDTKAPGLRHQGDDLPAGRDGGGRGKLR